jgi:hypothetical protein
MRTAQQIRAASENHELVHLDFVHDLKIRTSRPFIIDQ